jgi:methylglutaconyl-CoA hydratase
MTFTTLKITIKKQQGVILMNRPEVHNAFNDHMIDEIMAALDQLNGDPSVRVIILRGAGPSFSSGADLNWLKDVRVYDYHENLETSRALANCLHNIYTSPKPVVSVAHGAAIGGAVGLLVAADIALCTTDTILSLSEVRIGVIPACISPYIIKRTGEFQSKELMLTGKRINGIEAGRIFLVNKAVPADLIEKTLEQTVQELLASAPGAQKTVKKLVHMVSNTLSYEDAVDETAQILARIRQSEEAQEGMNAFLEKREPNWKADTE